MRRSSALDARTRALVAGADTFFIATWHPGGGADASHRGGRPGFVRVLDDRTLEFPDYPGNNMFNTLGNLVGHPRAGLLFVDFERGDLLQLTGRAKIRWEPATAVRRGRSRRSARLPAAARCASSWSSPRRRIPRSRSHREARGHLNERAGSQGRTR